MESLKKTISFKLSYKGITKRIPLQVNLLDQMNFIVKTFEIPSSEAKNIGIVYNSPNEDPMSVISDNDFIKFRSFLQTGNNKGVKFNLTNISSLTTKPRVFDEDRIAYIIANGIKQMESSIISSINDSIMQSRLESMSIMLKESLITVDCFICKRTREAQFIFYCLEPECKDIVICPNCVENGCKHSDEDHLLVKSYSKLNFSNMPKDLARKNPSEIDKPIDNGNISINENQSHGIEQSAYTDESLQSQFLNTDLSSIESKVGNNCRVLFKVRNSGKKTWPRGCLLVCLKDISQVEGEAHKIKIKINPGKDLNADIELKSQFLETGIYNSFWQMQTEKGKYFGELVELTVKVLL